ncbi:transposase domain-containing protein [Acidiphilium sp. PA]|uniref:transposase domain-containing protein n=1 Tax=Acidiphilium sp. PA TaxID=2871705 RepID=UPI0038CFC93E
MNGVNPETYFTDVLTRITDGHPINRIDELMPWPAIEMPGSSTLQRANLHQRPRADGYVSPDGE